MRIKNASVFTPDGTFVSSDIFTDQGHFSKSSTDSVTLDGTGMLLVPGLIDVHFHGSVGYDFCDGTIEAIQKIAAYELSQGVTSICPATMSLSKKMLQSIVETAHQYLEDKEQDSASHLCGIHLEGPFLSLAKKGAQNPKYLQNPAISFFEELQEASGNLIKLITLAPELPGAMQFIKQVKDSVHISIGHTSCDYALAKEALALGADHMTHFYNAMPPLSHREPGPIGAFADANHGMAELICDGVHIHPAVVRATFSLLGDDRIVLVSDSMRATGLTDGQYTLGGQDVFVKGNKATLQDGTIAGSVTNLYDCVKSAVSMGIPLAAAIKCATINPAKSIGLDAAYGSIEVGKMADCLLLDQETLSLQYVIKGGRVVYSY
ncbi:MAG: N-acetylglucosamine-6-phosphate deacetylase [Clostridiales bacterium]|nr:N-acetylglucosamine-6-phosphate deacetylase [Clostridiales bacterium]